MNNCLVTKLKGVVDNDNLPRYAALCLAHTVSVDTPDVFTIFGNIGTSMTIDSDEITELIDYSGNTHTIPWNIAFSTSGQGSQTIRVAQKGKLYIKSKYDLNGIELPTKNFQILGSFNDFVYKNPVSNVFRFVIPYQQLSGKLSSLLREDNIQYLSSLNIQDNLIEGTAAELGRFTNALTLVCLRSRVYGDVKDLVNSQIAGEVSTRSLDNAIYSNGVLAQLSFNGKMIKTEYPSFSYSYGWITWESAYKIAVCTGGDGVKDNYTHVACMGYTQEEAEVKWPDKTIVRVDA